MDGAWVIPYVKCMAAPATTTTLFVDRIFGSRRAKIADVCLGEQGFPPFVPGVGNPETLSETWYKQFPTHTFPPNLLIACIHSVKIADSPRHRFRLCRHAGARASPAQYASGQTSRCACRSRSSSRKRIVVPGGGSNAPTPIGNPQSLAAAKAAMHTVALLQVPTSCSPFGLLEA